MITLLCRLALLATILALSSISTTAHSPFINPVCKESCAPYDVVCMLREQTCQTKLDLYYAYMAQLNAGVTLHHLPALYVELLQKHFSGNLNDVLFGFSDRQPGAKATTDCSTVYFSGAAPANFVNKLKDGQLTTDSEFTLLLHELRHVSQCKIIGGRDAYAKMWFGHFDVSFLSQLTFDPKKLHDGMPMEKDAVSAASNFLTAITHNRDRDGKLVRPFALEVLAGTTVVGSSLTVFEGVPTHLFARVQGGSDPTNFLWSIKGPTDVFSHSLNGGRPDQKELDWTPDHSGDYTLAIMIIQFNSGLVPIDKVVKVKVLPRTKIVPATISN